MKVSPREFICAGRVLHGLTQAKLAAAAGVSQSSVSKIENDVKGVTFEDYESLLKALGYKLKVVKIKVVEEEYEQVGT